MREDEWMIIAKNLLEDKICNNCKWCIEDSNIKCLKQPKPYKVSPLIEDIYCNCPEIKTCLLWEKWR